MYNIIQSAHSGLAYLVLIMLVVAIINSFVGLSGKKSFLKKDRTLALVALILSHIQLLIGLVLYFVSPKGLSGLDMSNAQLRLTGMEHPLMVIIGLALITIGWSKHKKETTDAGKFKKIAVLYAIGLILILSRLPWSSWLA